MTSKHTPGPWYIEIDDTTTRVESKTFTICEYVSNCDADLISAAPDLLAALEKAMRCYGVDMQPAHRDEFRAAIAKARG